MTKRRDCPICNSDRLQEVKAYSSPLLIKCVDCALVFCAEIPSNQHLEEHYSHYGRNDYLSPITVKRYNDLLNSFEKYRTFNRILDVGCGIGFFLEEAKNHNWEAHGTEFTDEAINVCASKNIIMHKGDIEDIDFGEIEFDVITSFEVIEHLKDPLKHFQKAAKLLRKGGLMYITTPNFNSLNSRILKDKWNVISYPEHLNYFTKASLDHLMTLSGFKRISTRTEGISPGRLIKSRKGEKMDFSDKENIDENLRTSIEGNALLRGMKSVANQIMSTSGLGESLKGLYVKL